MQQDSAQKHSPAAERNRGPILKVLKRVLPVRGTVLEIGSGSGQHVAYFAPRLPRLLWIPSDPREDMRDSIVAQAQACGATNIAEPLDLDVTIPMWEADIVALEQKLRGIVAINVTQVAPWEATTSLLRGAAELLPPRGCLVIYGPFKIGGRHNSPSNAAFDDELRARNPEWGLRDVMAVSAEAARSGFEREEVVEMPANNLLLVFRRL